MKRILLRLLAFLVVAAFSAYGAVAFTARPAGTYRFFDHLPDDRPVVIAHRGGADVWPENTMVAFAGALALGSDVLEMDIFFTADGVPVVIHDETVDRTTNGSGLVESFTLAEIQQLDAAAEFPGYQGTGVAIPTLEQVFSAFPGVPMIVEIKPNDVTLADAVIELVSQYDRVDITLLGSFHHAVLMHIRQADPRLATHMSEGEVIPFLVAAYLFSEYLISPPAPAILAPPRSGPIPVLTTRFINAARSRGLFVAAWTINDAEEMAVLLNRGVQGLITDRPDLAVSAALERQR
jgi:glycerophosphoryl diester phosphodiesterase